MKRSKELAKLAPYKCDAKTKFEYIKAYLDAECPSTYYKDGTLQCYKYKNRSVRDLFYLTKARFKSTTVKELCKIIFKLANKDYNNYGFIYCNDIGDLIIFTHKMHNYSNFLQPKSFNIGEYNRFKEHRCAGGINYGQFLKIIGHE